MSGDYFSAPYFSSPYFSSPYFSGAGSGNASWDASKNLGAAPNRLSSLIYAIDFPLLENLWPQWMAHYYTTPSSGALFHNFLHNENADIQETNFYIKTLEQSLQLNPFVFEPRAGWVVEHRVNDSAITQVFVTVGTETVQLAHCASLYDFNDLLSPCFICTESAIYLRNLARAAVHNWNISGTLSIPTNELIPEDGLIVDYGFGWMFVPIEHATIINNNYVFTLGVTGAINIIYSSQTIYNELKSIRINGGPELSLQQFDFWNRFDELGLVVGLKRLKDETNYNFFQRIKAAFSFAAAPNEHGLGVALGRELDLGGMGTWSGVHTTFSAAAKHVRLKDYKYIESLKENLWNTGTRWYGSRQNWKSSIIIHGQEIINTVETSGGIEVAATTQVAAHYNFTTFSYSTSGMTTTISPNENTPELTTLYYYYKGLDINTLVKKAYYNNLFDAAKNPTSTMNQIANYIQTNVRATLGYTTWDRTIWFTDGDIKPELYNITEGLE